MSRQASVANLLAGWAASFTACPADLDLADGALKDTLAVTLAARGHRLAGLVADLPDAARWAAIGEFEAEVRTGNGDVMRTRLDFPPGSPQRPAEDADLLAKIKDCTQGVDVWPGMWTWKSAADVLRTYAPPRVSGAP